MFSRDIGGGGSLLDAIPMKIKLTFERATMTLFLQLKFDSE